MSVLLHYVDGSFRAGGVWGLGLGAVRKRLDRG